MNQMAFTRRGFLGGTVAAAVAGRVLAADPAKSKDKGKKAAGDKAGKPKAIQPKKPLPPTSG